MTHPVTWNQQRLAAVARGDEPADCAFVGGAVLSVHTREWLDADVLVAEGRIAAVVERRDDAQIDAATTVDVTGHWLTPGFIDAHVHIESSKLTIPGFAQLVVPRGTTCVVAEPHEIANVVGVDGTRWFMDSADRSPLDCRFMVPSCVPASTAESAGASLSVGDMAQLLQHPRALGVGELMNFPGIIDAHRDELAKTTVTGSSHADGHAPNVRGRMLDAYVAARIRSDHESTTPAEALDKRRRGMWVLLREASNAHDLVSLLPMVREFGIEFCALCTDDREPQDLARVGHIDHLLRLCVAHGVSAIDALVMATLHPALAHDLRDHGALVPGARADLVVLPDLEHFEPVRVYAEGRLVARDGVLCADGPAVERAPATVRDSMRVAAFDSAALAVRSTRDAAQVPVRIIEAHDGALLTGSSQESLSVVDGLVMPDAERDVLRLAVLERHHATGRIGTGFVRGFGLQRGAFASTVAHDAHNLVVAGIDLESMRACCDHLATCGGGIAVACEGQIVAELSLPVAGIMSDDDPQAVVAAMDRLHAELARQGVHVEAPFMMLSFLALSVIPALKLTDRGLFDVSSFSVTDVVVDSSHLPNAAMS